MLYITHCNIPGDDVTINISHPTTTYAQVPFDINCTVTLSSLTLAQVVVSWYRDGELVSTLPDNSGDYVIQTFFLNSTLVASTLTVTEFFPSISGREYTCTCTASVYGGEIFSKSETTSALTIKGTKAYHSTCKRH